MLYYEHLGLLCPALCRVTIMQVAGMTDEMMRYWHMQFEKLESQAYQEFLISL